MRFLNKLNHREKVAVLGGGIALVIFLVLQIGIFPLMEQKKQALRNQALKQEELKSVQRLSRRYQTTQAQIADWRQQVERRSQGFSLFAFMEKLAKEVEADIAYMKPSRTPSENENFPYAISKVEIKIQGINTKQLSEYLYKVETSENMIFVQRVSIRKKEKEGILDVILQAETFET